MEPAASLQSSVLETAENTFGRPALYYHPLVGGSALFAAVLASQAGLFFNPRLGAFLSVVSVAVLSGIAALSGTSRRLILSAMIIPLLSMINMSLVQESAFEQTAILYSSMLVLALVYRQLFESETKPMSSHLDWRGYALGLPGMAVIGGLLGLLGYKLLLTSYIFGGTRLWQVVMVAIIGAVAEESLFRGLIQWQAEQLMRPVYAGALASLLYLTLCFSHFTGWSLLVGGASSAILSAVYIIKPNLILTTTLNLASKLVYIGLVASFILR